MTAYNDLIARLLQNWTAWGSPSDREACVNETCMAMDCKEAGDAISQLCKELAATRKALAAYAQDRWGGGTAAVEKLLKGVEL